MGEERPVQEPSDPLVFGVETEVVKVTVTVHDGKGRLVTDLNVGDFSLHEDGQQQRIQLFGRARDPEGVDGRTDESLALDLGLLMDTSESMLAVLKLTQTAAVRFLDAIPRARHLLTVFFDHDIRISRYDSENQQGLYGRIFEAEGGGNTALYDAVAVSLSRLGIGGNRKVIVLFSDGEDSVSQIGYGELLGLVRASGATIYPIVLQDQSRGMRFAQRSMLVLRQLADVSGGRTFILSQSGQLGEIYTELLDELAGQYVLGFVSTNQEADGAYRKLRVEVAGDGLDVRHRKGYLAPARP
jgi:Ca-activated chloride channel family protein